MKKVTTAKDKLGKALMASMALSLGLSACTKPRNTKIADEVTEAELVTRAELEQDGYQLTLGSDASALDFDGKPVAVNEKPHFTVTQSRAPNKLMDLLKQAKVQGKAGQNLAIKFKVDTKNVFVLKRVDDASEIALLERDLIIQEKGVQYLPLFTIPVKSMGVLVRQKNDYGEQTYKQDLRETDLAQATHVRLDLRKESFRAVEISRNSPEARREIFLATEMQNRVTTVSELDGLLQTSLGLSDPQEKVVTRILKSSDTASSKVQILVYSLKQKSAIQDKKLLAKLNSGIENTEILTCSSQIQQAAGVSSDCVLVLERSLEGTSVHAKLELDGDGKPTNNVVFEETSAAQRMSLIRVGKNSPATEAGPEALRRWNPINTIKVTDLRDKEFLFRRTFQDASSSLSAFGPGASGGMEIVKIELEDERLVVRRADVINSERKAGQIDREELMSIPVRYYKLKMNNGVLLAQPKTATKNDADVITLDWTNNTLPVVASPLSYFEAGQCFVSVGNQTIEDMDMRLDQGVLNFSIQGSYAFRPECMSSFGLNDYWYGASSQSNFNLSERVSFRAYDKANDAKLNQDLPFRAQTMLGFGIFTMGKRVPDKFGNFGRIGNELALPVIQDFSMGKVLTYHLGGLPSDEAYRKIFIQTTRQVIADWNETLHRSFKNTSLDREGIYIDLKIDGEDSTPGHLGDLDRNYIWNFDKNLDSGLLGMSQSAPNPRTGIVEANNVLMYSGNLLSYIGHEKKSAEIVASYNAFRKQAVKQLLDEEKAEAARATPQSKMSRQQGKASLSEAAKFVFNLTTKNHELSAPLSPVLTKNSSLLANAAQKVQAIRTRGVDLKEKKTQALQIEQTKKAYLRRIVEKALQMNATKDETLLEALSAAEILKTYGPELSAEVRMALSLQSRQLALAAEFKKNFAKGPGCVMTASSIPHLTPGELANTPTEQIFSNWYAKTLSHEIGHSLGLTHNFKGSTDVKNFRHSDEASERQYSSIMDYFPGSGINYQKPGPYDTHALRAGYTGLVQVSDELAKKATRQSDGKTRVAVGADGRSSLEILSGSLVRLSDLRDVVTPPRKDDNNQMIHSWWDVNATQLAQVPTKFYAFCTDVHVGGDPTCNRWDTGTTPGEIARFYIDQYNELYPLMNSRNDRINMPGMGSYIGRIIGDFMSIRSFLDETFFRATRGYSDVQDYAEGAYEAYQFFINVANTPEKAATIYDLGRFELVNYTKKTVRMTPEGEVQRDQNGAPLFDETPGKALIEAKAPQDLLEPGFDDLVGARGIEYDKAFALMMLTQRDIGNPRYESVGLRLSFAEFEKFVLNQKASSSLIMRTLRETMSNNQTGFQVIDGGLIQAPIEMMPQATDLVRYFSVMSSSVYLESDTLEDKDNFAALFRVGSTLGKAPADRISVTKLDQNINSPGALKYWAFDNASIASELIFNAARKRLILENHEALAATLVKILAAQSQEDRKTATDEMLEQLKKLNQENRLVSSDEQKMGFGVETQLNATLSSIQKTMQVLIQLQTALAKGGASNEALQAQVDEVLASLKKSNEFTAKLLPLLIVGQEALLKLTQKSPVLTQLTKKATADTEFLKMNVGIITANLQTLNKIVIMMNPELNR